MFSICVIGHDGRMGGFHKARLRDRYEGIIYICGCDKGDEIPDTDCYIVATPSDTHFEIAKSLIEQGKHVLVEKPITMDYHEAQVLYRLAQEYDVVLMVGHTERFNPVFRRRLSDLYNRQQYDFTRLTTKAHNGRDPIWDVMIHDLEIFCYLNNLVDIAELSVKKDGLRFVVRDGWSLTKGSFLVGYDAPKEVRHLNSLGMEIDFLAADSERTDSLQGLHAQFIKLCKVGCATGHARFAVAAVALAEEILRADK